MYDHDEESFCRISTFSSQNNCVAMLEFCLNFFLYASTAEGFLKSWASLWKSSLLVTQFLM